MLDINEFGENGKWQGEEGMCLLDAVIDLEKGTIKHFMETEAWKRGIEK